MDNFSFSINFIEKARQTSRRARRHGRNGQPPAHGRRPRRMPPVGPASAEATERTVRVAVVDMGTNSTRLLVADVGPRGLTEVERRSTVTRLGRGVDTSGTLAT